MDVPLTFLVFKFVIRAANLSVAHWEARLRQRLALGTVGPATAKGKRRKQYWAEGEGGL